MLTCECRGATKNLTIGQGTVFYEYNVLCEDCLKRAHEQEFTKPIDVALSKLNELNINEEDIYGFSVDGSKVVVQYFNSERQLITTTLISCNDENEAIDILCELC